MNSLQTLCNEIRANISDYDYEMIFIDDGSTDGSYVVLSALAEHDKKIKIIKFRKNFGKAEALNIGFETASGDIVFTMDADLQDDPAEIPAFIKKINEGWDLVSGWKVKRRDPISKILPSMLFNYVTSKVFGIRLHDFNCGFKAYRKEVVTEIDVYGEMHRYIPALADNKGFKINEIQVNHRARKFGKSKYGVARFFRGFLDLLTVKLVTKFNRSPLYLFGGIGFITSGVGFLLSLYLTFIRLFKMVYLSNRPLLFLAILLIMVGMQFISIGLIGELLVNQTRKKNKDRVSVSVEKVVNL